MSDCRRTADRLTPYVDEALPPAERADVEHHLTACPPCRVSAEQEQGGRTVLRERAEQLRHESLPPGLRTRCAAIARQHTRGASAAVWRTRLLPASLAVALVLFTAFTVVMLATQRSNTLLAAQLTADHAKCFRVFPPPDRDLDARVAEERLSSQYGWDIHVPPSSARDGVRLVSARRCLYGDGRVPHLLYDADGHPLSLFVIEGVARPDADVTTFGHRSRIWSRGPTTFVLVSPASAGDLTRAVSYVRQAAQ
ncbi:MAG TPA: zf-HC2 domain-containing protein [Vicinamibacterales bacterium]